MIFVQTILLKVALDNRPPSGMRDGLEHAPFSAYNREGIIQQILLGKRPYQFWQWPTPRPYVDILVTPTYGTMLSVKLDLQILSIPSLPLPMSLRHTCLPRSHLLFRSIHLFPRLLRSCHRSHPSASADLQEPSSTLLQGLPIVRDRQLAGR